MMLSKTVVFCVSIAVASAALSIGPLETKPEKFKNVEGCYIKDMDAVLPFGTSAPSKTGCFEYRCGSDYIEIASCGIVKYDLSGRPDCYLMDNDDKPYPACCTATIKCPEDTDSENKI